MTKTAAQQWSYICFFFSYSSRQIQYLEQSKGVKNAFRKTNIGVFLKIATDCNFFFEK
jgi:hypothetical protein